MQIRKINKNDYHKNYLNLLSQLTIIGDISQNDFDNFIDDLNDNYQIWVIEDLDKIIATGTLVKEKKLIHNCGKLGRIEEIVIDIDYRNKNLGKKMVDHLISESNDCYKVSLTCKENLESFYAKSGLTKSGVSMTKYH
jgi:glucosamine-phosphate N-acetyltransferase